MSHISGSQDSFSDSVREFEAVVGSVTRWQASQQTHLISFRPYYIERSIAMMEHSDRTETLGAKEGAGDVSCEKPLPATPLSSRQSFPQRLMSSPLSFGSSIMKGARRLSVFKGSRKDKQRKASRQFEPRVQLDKGTQTEPPGSTRRFGGEVSRKRRDSKSSGGQTSSTCSPGKRAKRCFRKRNDSVKHSRKGSKSVWPAVSAFPHQIQDDAQHGKSKQSIQGKRNSWTETPSAMAAGDWAYTGPAPWGNHARSAAAATTTTVDSIGTYESRYSDPSRKPAQRSAISICPTDFLRRTCSESSIAVHSTLSDSASAALGVPQVAVEEIQRSERASESPYQMREAFDKSKVSVSKFMPSSRKRGRTSKLLTDNGSVYESPLRQELAVDQVVDASAQPITAPAVVLHPTTPAVADGSLKYQVYFPAFTPAVETDVPEHFKGSPLCPLHPKNKSVERFCPFHGRLPKEERVWGTPTSMADSEMSNATIASDSSGIDPLDTRGFQLQVPKHSPNSPMCPANIKYNPQGRGVCVYHGRGISRGATESSEDSVPRKDAMMNFTSGG